MDSPICFSLHLVAWYSKNHLLLSAVKSDVTMSNPSASPKIWTWVRLLLAVGLEYYMTDNIITRSTGTVHAYLRQGTSYQCHGSGSPPKFNHLFWAHCQPSWKFRVNPFRSFFAKRQTNTRRLAFLRCSNIVERFPIKYLLLKWCPIGYLRNFWDKVKCRFAAPGAPTFPKFHWISPKKR